MLYHVTRNNQSYGPYTLEDLQRYVASGNVLATDLAKSEEMAEWVPVSQVLGTSMPPVAAGVGVPYAGPAVPVYAAGTQMYPDPPNLHWALVLLIGFFCSFFIWVWEIVQAVWMRKVNPQSKALYFYIANIVVLIGGIFLYMGFMVAMQSHQQSQMMAGVFMLLLFAAVFTLAVLARFDMRRSMLEHFNGPEPIGLTLSPVMTFFFGLFYFQYHFSRINEMKQAARYRGTAI